MDVASLLTDAYRRVGEVLHRAVEGLDGDALAYRPDRQANTLAWLAWHGARVQDAQLAALMGTEQVWIAGGWVRRLSLPFDDHAGGYGQAPDEVAQVIATAGDLLGYYDAVAATSLAYLAGLTSDDLDEVVDTRWDPPVTRGARLVSIVADDLQHAGQAAYLRGLVDRARINP